MPQSRVLLIVAGGIAAFKIPELIRQLRRENIEVVPVLTKGGAEFVTPLTLSALAEQPCHTELFDLTRESEMGHIRLSRNADLVVVAPATADLMARMAAGMADDLASTLLLATDKPVLVAPAMNVRMWLHPATQRNRELLLADGIGFIGPEDGDMACGEFGPGRMAEPDAILSAILARLRPGQPHGAPAVQAVPADHRLAGRHVIVTSGPTHEPIDPVRYIANRSSGAQGTAIASALRDMGARVSFVTGPAMVPPPGGVDVIRVETAREMRAAVEAALPADAAVMAAAVADWHVTNATGSKIKKDGSGRLPVLEFSENPDILAWIGALDGVRPELVVGFAAETDDVIANATSKLRRKRADWIVANDVRPETGIMGGAENAVTLVTDEGAEEWPRMDKTDVARRLAERIADALTGPVLFGSEVDA